MLLTGFEKGVQSVSQTIRDCSLRRNDREPCAEGASRVRLRSRSLRQGAGCRARSGFRPRNDSPLPFSDCKHVTFGFLIFG